MPGRASDADVMALAFCLRGHSSRTESVTEPKKPRQLSLGSCIFDFRDRRCVQRMRIAVLLHERDGDFWTGDYLLKHLAKEWQGAGVSVLPVFGPKRFVSADAAILHVDLTRIPEPSLQLARRNRRTVNGRVEDIGKRTFSAHIVRPGDGYEGPVIVKTERNH